MYIKKLELMTVESTAPTMSKEERYEIIAMIAEKHNAAKNTAENEERYLWDSNDIELNFGELVYGIN